MKPLSAFRPVGALLWLWCMLALVGQAQTPERNYVLSRTYKQKGASEANGNTYAGNAYQVTTQVSYIDGLGQPTQQITAFAGPNGQDLLVRTEYDHQFRPVKVHSPLPIGSNTGRYVNSPDGLYYNDGNRFCQPTTNAYTESVYEPSPLNRPQEQKAPGVGTGVRTAYQVNAGSPSKNTSRPARACATLPSRAITATTP